MKCTKRPVTLMEVLIAMVLTVLVLTTLTFFYRQVMVIGNEIDEVKKHDFYTRYVENRLMDVLPKTLSPKDKDFAFFSFGDDGTTKLGSQNLIFTFFNGVSLEKEVANHAIGRLFVDPEGRLTFAYWPTPKQWDKPEEPPIKKEILLEGVEAIEFSFFIAPEVAPEKPSQQEEQGGKGGDTKKQPPPKPKGADGKKEEASKEEEKPVPEPKGDWRVQPWLKEYADLPVLIKMSVQMKGENEKKIFMFPLANSKTHIIYD